MLLSSDLLNVATQSPLPAGEGEGKVVLERLMSRIHIDEAWHAHSQQGLVSEHAVRMRPDRLQKCYVFMSPSIYQFSHLWHICLRMFRYAKCMQASCNKERVKGLGQQRPPPHFQLVITADPSTAMNLLW